MTSTIPTTRAEALARAEAESWRRYVLESFDTVDPEDEFGGASAGLITLWGVFDADNRHDGRRGMVWVPGVGFQAHADQDIAQGLLRNVQITLVQSLMEVWEQLVKADAEPVHNVIRLDVEDAPDTDFAAARRLRQLAAVYDQAKSAADQAAAHLKEITDGIKAEVRRLHPGGTDFTVTSRDLAHPLTLTRVTARVFDTASARKVLTEQQYDALCKDRESWVLKAKKG